MTRYAVLCCQDHFGEMRGNRDGGEGRADDFVGGAELAVDVPFGYCRRLSVFEVRVRVGSARTIKRYCENVDICELVR